MSDISTSVIVKIFDSFDNVWDISPDDEFISVSITRGREDGSTFKTALFSIEPKMVGKLTRALNMVAENVIENYREDDGEA